MKSMVALGALLLILIGGTAPAFAAASLPGVPAQINQLSTAVDAISLSIGSLGTNLTSVSTAESNLQSQVNNIQSEVDNLDLQKSLIATIPQMQDQINNSSSAIQALQSNVNLNTSDISTLQSNNALLNSQVSSLTSTNATLQTSVTGLQTSLPQVQVSLSAQNAFINELQADYTNLGTQQSTLSNGLATLNTQVTQLGSAVSAIHPVYTLGSWGVSDSQGYINGSFNVPPLGMSQFNSVYPENTPPRGIVVPANGTLTTLTAVDALANQKVSSGSAQFEVFVNGVDAGFGVTLDATHPTSAIVSNGSINLHAGDTVEIKLIKTNLFTSNSGGTAPSNFIVSVLVQQ